MLHNKIKKIICILSAVIIAFSCFSITSLASETDTPSVGGIKILDIMSYCGFVVYDETGEVVDTYIINIDKFQYNSEGDTLYIDCSSSEYPFLCKPGYIIELYIYFSDEVFFLPRDSVYLAYTFPNGYKFLDGGHEFDNLNSSGEVISTDLFSDVVYLNGSYYHQVLLPKATFLGFEAIRNLNTVSFTISLVKLKESMEDLKVNTSPGKYKFFSDMNSFFKSSVSWFSDIFKKVATVPALTVLVLGFVIVGFGFGLLRKLTHST